MTILEQVYASGGDCIISTLELTCPAWTAPILICNGGLADVDVYSGGISRRPATRSGGAGIRGGGWLGALTPPVRFVGHHSPSLPAEMAASMRSQRSCAVKSTVSQE